MELALAGGIALALVLLYYTAKRNGRLEEQKRAQSLQIQAQAKDMANLQESFFELQDQVNKWDLWREKIDERLKGVDVRILPDSTVQRLYKDPTIVVEVTDPHSTKLEKGKPAK